MRVLVLCAHADDEILGVGGTIIRHVEQGHQVHVAIMIGRPSRALAKREALRRQNDMGARYDAEVLAQRKRQGKEVASYLGLASSRFLDLEDETLEQDLTRTVAAIEDCIQEVRPHIVYTHHCGDSNQDHRGVFLASIVATRSYLENSIRRVLSYEVLSATEQASPLSHFAFMPNYYVDISQVLPRKIEAMRIYGDELRDFPHPRSMEGITTLAAYRGMAAGCTAAEAFVLHREVVGRGGKID